MTTPKVFISYSHSDRQWVREFAKTMLERGVKVRFDEVNVKAGQRWGNALEKGLRESDVVVLLVGSDNAGLPEMFFQIGAALGMHKRVIPLVLEDFQTSRLPFRSRSVRFLERNSPQETAKRVATAIQALPGEAA